MDYVQEKITTLHILTDEIPTIPMDGVSVVIPIAERDFYLENSVNTFRSMEQLDIDNLFVALRCGKDKIEEICQWLNEFDIPLDIIWCNGERVQKILRDEGIAGRQGKGYDIWIALGLASEKSEFIICQDVDRETYVGDDISRLLLPLKEGNKFVKGYYARVGNGKLYGRLNRLFYVPLLRAIGSIHDDSIVKYLEAFRYGLSGEFGIESEIAKKIRIERLFGLEVGMMGEAFRLAGFESTVQVDMGICDHTHREVIGPNGLSKMSLEVSGALFRVLQEYGVELEYKSILKKYDLIANKMVKQYRLDAKYNSLMFDELGEKFQIAEYRKSIVDPENDDRLPPWNEISGSKGVMNKLSCEDMGKFGSEINI